MAFPRRISQLIPAVLFATASLVLASLPAASNAQTAPSVAGQPASGEIVFDVIREDSPMGTHSLRFTPKDDRLTVEIAIDLKVDLGPFTLFRYTHRNREEWQNGRLIAMQSTTDDDGIAQQASVRLTGDRLKIDGTEGRFDLPPDALATTYWHEEMVRRPVLIDSANGGLRKVQVRPLAETALPVGGVETRARGYRVTGDLDLEIFYLENGEWAGLKFRARGSDITYVRRTSALASAVPPGFAPQGAANTMGTSLTSR